MESLITRFFRKNNSFTTIYTATFLVAFHVFLMVYINSSFLNQFVSEKYVGLLYIIGSLSSITAIIILPTILRLFGNYFTLILLTIFEIFILLGLAFIQKATIILPLFIAHLVVFQIMLINIDIFFETFQKKETDTGSKKGIALTIINLGLILSVLTAGFILKNNDFWKIYLISALIMIPFFIIILTRFRKFKDPVYSNLKTTNTIKKIRENKNIKNIFIAQFLLKFFYSLMVIYMPIYLHDHVGFSWPEISIMFTIMLLPFVLLEIPAGKIADKWLGEKEILLIGFIITALFTIIISFISIPSFLLWTAILFLTRIGASLIEISTESFFFKHVKGDDASIISFFRMTHPLAYVVGPIIAIITLQFMPYQYIFLVLGIIMLIGIKYALSITDTK